MKIEVIKKGEKLLSEYERLNEEITNLKSLAGFVRSVELKPNKTMDADAYLHSTILMNHVLSDELLDKIRKGIVETLEDRRDLVKLQIDELSDEDG